MNELLIEETLSTVKIQPTKSKNILWTNPLVFLLPSLGGRLFPLPH